MWEQIYSTHWTNVVSMGPLLICSILMLAIILERLFVFRPSRLFDQKQFDEVVNKLHSGNKDAAIQQVVGRKNLQEEIIHTGLTDVYQRNVIPEVAFLENGLGRLDILAKWTGALSFLAKIAPLFGLLGTVLGMIVSFEVIAKTGADGEVKPNEIAMGIGVALLTTAAGLIVAIPALVANAFISTAGKNVYEKFEKSLQKLTIASGGFKTIEQKAPATTETPINLIKNEEFAHV